MFYIYSKEKLPKLLFDVNLTSEEVKLYGGWDVIFSYYPDIKKDETIIVERNAPFNYPILNGNTIREITREEKVENDIEVQLEDGEVIRDKKIVKIEKPKKNEKYLTWNKEKEQWYYGTERERKDYFNTIDNLKATVLDYGFDYEVEGEQHRQRCRDKDIIWIAMSALLLFLVKTFMGKEIKKTWYFEDDFGKEMDLMGFIQLMFFGSTFIQSVYDTENYFKTKVNPKELTKSEFEAKRKEIHNALAKG